MKRTLSLVVIAGLLAACGGDADTADTADIVEEADDAVATTPDDTTDDDTTDDDPTDDDPTDDDPTTTVEIVTEPETSDDAGDDDVDGDVDGDGGDDGDRIVISDLSDMPGECRDAMVTYLQAIEPAVEEIDWGNATMNDMEVAGAEMEAATEAFDESVAGSICGDIEFGEDDEDGFAMALELARDVAPGVVPWLEFIEDMSAMDPDQGGEANADLPQDCDAAIEYMEEVFASADSMNELPFSELSEVSAVLSTIGSTCDMEQVNSFFDDNSAFLDG